MKQYKLIAQDTFNKLELNKIYNIKNNWLYNENKTIKIYRITNYQLKNMFEEV